jgi:hypothetical protein
MKQGHALVATMCEFFGWDPNNIKFHYEDPATDHACPGKNVVKSEYIADVIAYMGSGGGDTDTPQEPRQGTVVGLVSGDTLNVRSQASSSSPIIGTADNGDILVIINESWNGSTQYYRIQIGEGEGTGVEVFGYVSAAYVQVDEAPESESEWHTDITATVFGMAGDEQDSAYPDIDWITSSTRGVSFPYKWRDDPDRPEVEIEANGRKVVTGVVDVGPWNTDDPNYVLGTARPMAESQFRNGDVAQNGQVPTNPAGIDLTEPIANELGISGKGSVRWRYAGEVNIKRAERTLRRRATKVGAVSKKKGRTG